MIFDFIISGLGPSGAFLSYELSKMGYNVLALEKNKLPRYKACGGGLTPKILNVLPFSINELIENHTDTIGFSYKMKEKVLIKAKAPFCYTVMRKDFDHFLACKASNAGSKINECEKLINFSEKKELIEVETDKCRYKTQYLIGADGATSLIAKKSRLAEKKRFYLTLTAEIHMPEHAFNENRSISWGDFGGVERGYAWILPKKNHSTLGVGNFYVSNKKIKHIRNMILNYTENYSLLKNAVIHGPIRGHYIPTLIDNKSLIARGNIFLVGDAAGLVDPFTGEGIYYALRSSQILAKLFSKHKDINDIQNEYHRIVSEEIISEFKIADKIAKLVYGFPGYAHRLLKKYNYLGDYYLNVLSGHTSYANTYERLTYRIKSMFLEKSLGLFSGLIKQK